MARKICQIRLLKHLSRLSRVGFLLSVKRSSLPCCGLYFRPPPSLLYTAFAALCEASTQTSASLSSSLAACSVVNSREFWIEEYAISSSPPVRLESQPKKSAMHAGGVTGGGGGYGKKDPLEVSAFFDLAVLAPFLFRTKLSVASPRISSNFASLAFEQCDQSRAGDSHFTLEYH